MAVEGKLVPQDPNDEPASVLLERIREEKQRLIAEGKAKFPKGGESIIYIGSDGSPYEKRIDAKGRVLSEKCIADEVPFEKLPEGWAWARIGAITELVNGRAFKPSDWTPSGLPIVRIQNLNNPDSPYNRYDGDCDSKFLLYGGELLFAWSGTPGTSFGAHVWNGGKALLNQHIFNVRFSKLNLDINYFELSINQSVLSLIDLAHGSTDLRRRSGNAASSASRASSSLPYSSTRGMSSFTLARILVCSLSGGMGMRIDPIFVWFIFG